MAEPISTTTVGATSIGITALLIGWIGPVGADVMMVVMSAMAGCVVAMSGVNSRTPIQAIKFISAGVLLSLVLAWASAELISQKVPEFSGPYAPSIVAFIIGAAFEYLPLIIKKSIYALFRFLDGLFGGGK